MIPLRGTASQNRDRLTQCTCRLTRLRVGDGCFLVDKGLFPALGMRVTYQIDMLPASVLEATSLLPLRRVAETR